MEERISVALDGPSGAGKSTIARAIARRFCFVYVDTGAIYRTVGLAAWRRGVPPRDRERVASMLPELDIALRHGTDGLQRMYLNGEDVTEQIRQPEISLYASDVSAIPAVRAFLMDMQRDMARRYDVVMDGRDIGTVVLPSAGLKVFLTAAPEVRAERRFRELREKGTGVTLEEVFRDIQYRDENDSSRSAAPLRPAEDAVILDTSALDFQASCEAVARLVEEKFGL